MSEQRATEQRATLAGHGLSELGVVRMSEQLSADQRDDSRRIECPHCHGELHINPLAVVPDEQKFTMEMTFEGPMIAAKTIGESITSTAELLSEIAKAAGEHVEVMIHGLSLVDSKVRISYVILARKTK